jgi:hypothetical protein
VKKFPIIFEPNSSWHRYASGVYKLTFGHRFYIGRTNLLYNRWYNHFTDINKLVNGSKSRTLEYYGETAQYLIENPKINVGYLRLVAVCQSFDEMCIVENSILNSYKGNPDILNRSLSSVRPDVAPKFMIEIKKIKNELAFYNPYHCEISKEGDLLTALGSKKVRQYHSQREDDIEYLLSLQDYLDKYGKVSLEKKINLIRRHS